MPQLYDITKWNAQPWFSTGGTRSKKYVQDPETGKFYYYKRSFKNENREYFFEFWSEVAASEVGALLGFNLLRYDIAIDHTEMGCISESMIPLDGEELIEGGKYLQAYDFNFNPEVHELRNMYSFQLIEKSLETFKLSDYMENLIEIIVFDALIGNSDRHQENWAFINMLNLIPASLKQMESAIQNKDFEKAPGWLKSFLKFSYKRVFNFEKKAMKPEAKMVQLYLQKTKCFAPIYDSGSSLGRELVDEKVNNMLRNEQEFEAYLDRGVSEIHWEEEKLNHFDLINVLLQTSYAEMIEKTILRISERFNEKEIERIIFEMDALVPENLTKFKLPEPRKRLMVKLITSRYQNLKALLDERV